MLNKQKIVINTINNHPREMEVKEVLSRLLKEYRLPTYTEEINVEFKARPHSHPILTMNTRILDWRCVMKQFVHEQMHWFHHGHPKEEEGYIYLHKKYPLIDKEEFKHNRPRSFWTHIVVCWNTENFLRNIISQENLDYMNSECQSYVKTEKMIRDKFDEIRKDLEKFDMIAPVSI